MNLRWRAIDDDGWTAASEEARCRLLLLKTGKEIVAGVPLLMKIQEEGRSCELLRRSSSPLLWRMEAATVSTEEREGVKTGPWLLLWRMEIVVAAFVVAGAQLVICEFRDLFTEDIEERLAWLCISTANRRLTAGRWGGILFQRIILAQSVLK